MELQSLIYLFVGISFTIYFGLALWTKASSTKDFYIAQNSFSPVTNGISVAVDFISAVTFIALSGTVSLLGFNGSAYIMGFTGGFVLLALLIVPYLRKFGQFTITDFIEARYYSKFVRNLAIFIVVIVSFIYISAQMKGIGIVFSRIFQLEKDIALIIAIAVAFFYSLIGGMRSTSYTQIAQYGIILFAFLTPVIYLSLDLTNTFLPQLAIFSKTTFAFSSGIQNIPEGTFLLHALDTSLSDFGFSYTSPSNFVNLFAISLALMLGVASLPHILAKFISTPSVADTRESVLWALIFIAIIYTTLSSLGALSKINVLKNTQGIEYETFINDEIKNSKGAINSGKWLKTWEEINYVQFNDKNSNGKIDINPSASNELLIQADVQTLINPEIANLPNWAIALTLAGALAAALSTITGLILIISSTLSQNYNFTLKNSFFSKIVPKFMLFVTIFFATYFTIPNFSIVQTVAISFNILAATLFPIIILGIFDKRTNKQGAIWGMIIGLIFTLSYIIYFLFIVNSEISVNNYLFGISPEGIGIVGAFLNFIVAIILSRVTSKVPDDIILLIDDLRSPTQKEVSKKR